MTDPYDLLMDQALLNGIRISPLFRVFYTRDGWAVCGTNLEGDPVFTHATHKTLRRAFNQANKLNAENGSTKITLKPAA